MQGFRIATDRREWKFVILFKTSNGDKPSGERALQKASKTFSAKLLNAKEPFGLQLMLKNERDLMDSYNICAAAQSATQMLASKRRKENLRVFANLYQDLMVGMKTHCLQMDPKGVADCLWALGRAVEELNAHSFLTQSEQYIYVYEELCMKAWELRSQMKASDIAHVLWSMAQVGWNEQARFEDFIFTAIKINDPLSFKVNDIVLILQALEKYKHQNVAQISFFTNSFKRILNTWVVKSKDVSAVMSSLRNMRFYDPELISTISGLIIDGNLILKTTQDISDLMLSYGELGLDDRRVLRIVVQQYNRFVQSVYFSLESFVDMVYALSLVKAPLELTQSVMESSRKRLKTIKNKNVDVYRLRRAQFAFQSRSHSLLYPTNLQSLCTEENKSWIQTEISRFDKSLFFDQVFDFVLKHYPKSQRLYMISEGEICLHIVVQGDNEQQKIGLQLCQTSDYTLSKPRRLMGSIKQSLAIIKGQGWRVQAVSQFDWEGKVGYENKLLDKIRKLFQVE